MQEQPVLIEIPCSYHKYKLPTSGALYILFTGLYFEQKPFDVTAPEHLFIPWKKIQNMERLVSLGILPIKSIQIDTTDDEHVRISTNSF
jgi:hypothetical protein